MSEDAGKVDVSHLARGEVLRRLYNASFSGGLGRLHFRPDDMTLAQADALIAARLSGGASEEVGIERQISQMRPGDLYFDYLHGRVLKIDLRDLTRFDVRLYDRDNGPGAAARALGVPKGGS